MFKKYSCVHPSTPSSEINIVINTCTSILAEMKLYENYGDTFSPNFGNTFITKLW